MKKELNEKVEIVITRKESGFDWACERAYQEALYIFGINEDGHFTKVKDSDRSTDFLTVEFKTYKHLGSMGGQSYNYIFDAWVSRNEDDLEDS